MELNKETCPCLSSEQIEGLIKGGIITAMNFLFESQQKVMDCGTLSNVEYEWLKQTFLDLIRPVAVTAKNVALEDDFSLMSTGIQGLDNVLGGGLMGGEVLEIYGTSGSCKTQMSLRIVAEFCHFRPDPACAVYFDMKNDFRASRFKAICEESAENMKNILVIRSSTFTELIEDIQTTKQEIKMGKSFHSNIKLVVLDSLPMVLYPAVDEETSSWRFQLEVLSNELSQLKALNNGIAVVVINHAVKIHSKSAWNKGQLGSGYKPAMGKLWNHKPDFRLYVVDHHRLTCGKRLNATLEKSTRTQTKKTFELILNTDGTFESSQAT